MGVQITIDLDAAAAFGKIGALKAALGSLDDDLDFDGDFDFEVGELHEVIDGLEELSETLDGLKDLEGAGGGDINVTAPTSVTVPDGGGGTAEADGGGGVGIGPGKAKRIARNFEDRFDLPKGTMDAETLEGMTIKEVRADIGEFYHDFKGKTMPNRGLGVANLPDEFKLRDDGRFDRPMGATTPMGAMRESAAARVFGEKRARQIFNRDGLDADQVRRWTSLNRAKRAVSRSTRRLDRSVKRAIPNMRQWYKLIAVLLPLLIAFAVQALGIAAALGAVAVAGAAVVGMGLIGHAEDMGEAWQGAKERLSDLKEELFETFQPTMQAFAPISDQFFDRLPGQLQKVADAMEGLTDFGPSIQAALSGITNWTARAFDGMVRMRAVIEELAFRFGAILADNVGAFFRFIIREAYENQEALIQLGQALKNIGHIIYNVSVLAAYLVNTFGWFLDLLRVITSVLRDRWTVAILTALAAGYMFARTVIMIIGAIETLAGLKLAGFFASYLGWTNLSAAATWRLAAGIAAVTAGLSLLAGYMAFKGFENKINHELAEGVGARGRIQGPGRGNSDRIYNDNRSFTINNDGDGYASESRIRDTIERTNAESAAASPPHARKGPGRSSNSRGGR